MPPSSPARRSTSTAAPAASVDTMQVRSTLKQGGHVVTNTESLRPRQRAQIRTDIRRAAFRLFTERGYDAVTTEEIAAAAGISPRTLFRHIPTKDELLLGPLRHAGSSIITLLERRPARESPDTAL